MFGRWAKAVVPARSSAILTTKIAGVLFLKISICQAPEPLIAGYGAGATSTQFH
jgi:hypothetical protein